MNKPLAENIKSPIAPFSKGGLRRNHAADAAVCAPMPDSRPVGNDLRALFD
jgi:hypothetical protein